MQQYWVIFWRNEKGIRMGVPDLDFTKQTHKTDLAEAISATYDIMDALIYEIETEKQMPEPSSLTKILNNPRVPKNLCAVVLI